MYAGHELPELLLARVRSASGPYRVDDALAIAYCAPNVGRLVALESAVRGRCALYERTAIPEICSAIVEHAVAPYAAGETLTLYFVDPAIARIRRDATPPQPGAEGVSYLSQDLRQPQTQTQAGEAMTLRADDRMTDTRTPGKLGFDQPTSQDRLADRATPNEGVAVEPIVDSPAPPEHSSDRTIERTYPEAVPSTSFAGTQRPVAQRAPDAQTGIIVRLEWSAERVRRFIQVVDRLFTIDRLGWYRHCLAMRLLIPDEIRSGDELADVEAMRHLHALRAAAVSALGKPLLAACMPGFTVTGDWLESLESSREARAIAGLRDALLPCATDGAEEEGRLETVDAVFTVGTVSKRALLAEGATSVESFLPVLIATQAHDAALGSRLTDYRNLLVELFAQTARATDPVRLGTLTQPNHSLDDRLWQLVGAVGEAFGGFVRS